MPYSMAARLILEIPAIVGGNQATGHGLYWQSIPAKKYGIQTGEPIVDAREMSFLVVIPPVTFYMKCSEAMIKILKGTVIKFKYSVLMNVLLI